VHSDTYEEGAMQVMKAFWIAGFMPIQLLLLISLFFVTFVAGHHVLRRMGRSIPVLGQAILIGLAAYSVLKYVIAPPIPSSLLYTYMGLITLVIFLLVSSVETSWKAFKYPIVATVAGETKRYRRIRAIVFTTLPVLVLVVTYNFMRPTIEEPTGLRITHPAPPRSVTVHGVTYDLQTARNPFRVKD
jgi:hypothetical protein